MMWDRLGTWLLRQLDKFSRRLFRALFRIDVERRLDMAMLARWEAKASTAKNPLLRFGAKYFSQSDEDGILLEILKRLGIQNGVFVEIGVGDGLENNTLILLMLEWRGLWLGGQEVAFRTEGSDRLSFRKQWITPKNVDASINEGLADLQLEPKDIDLLSVDIDSFDRDVVESILSSGVRPQIIIVEYNAKFPPPIRFSVPVGESWDGSDYMGCSLQSWWDLLIPCGYKLIVCNITGTNAFFVRAENSHLFEDAPKDIHELFMPCDYNWFMKVGHPTSPRTIRRFIE